MGGTKDCSILCPVYRITCNLCSEFYIGESSRTGHERFSEHLRYATNPGNKSYREEALAIHYAAAHPGMTPDLIFDILQVERRTVIRKIVEALFIYNDKPFLNDKQECKLLERFLVTG